MGRGSLDLKQNLKNCTPRGIERNNSSLSDRLTNKKQARPTIQLAWSWGPGGSKQGTRDIMGMRAIVTLNKLPHIPSKAHGQERPKSALAIHIHLVELEAMNIEEMWECPTERKCYEICRETGTCNILAGNKMICKTWKTFINQLDLTDIYRTQYSTAECLFFSSVHRRQTMGIFTKFNTYIWPKKKKKTHHFSKSRNRRKHPQPAKWNIQNTKYHISYFVMKYWNFLSLATRQRCLVSVHAVLLCDWRFQQKQ